MEHEDDSFAGKKLVKETVGAEPSPPDALLSLHFLDITKVGIERKAANGSHNPLGVTLRASRSRGALTLLHARIVTPVSGSRAPTGR